MKKWLGAAVAVILVAAAWPVAARFLEGPPRDEAIALVPADAFLYANVFLDPPGDQADALDALLEQFPKVESADDAKRDLFELFDEELEKYDITFQDDIEPWLGHQVSFYMSAEDLETEPRLAIFVAVDDQDAAERAIERTEEIDEVEEPRIKTYEAIDYKVYDDQVDGDPFALGFVRRHLVAGTEEAFRDVVDTSLSMDGLAASDAYLDSFRGLADENVASAYFDQSALFEEIAASGEAPFAESPAFEKLFNTGPAASVLTLSEDSVAIESSSEASPFATFATLGLASAGSELIGGVPGTSWAAFGLPELGKTISSFIDLFAEMGIPGVSREQIAGEFKRATGLDLDADVLSWMGDAALFVQGDSVPALGGGLVLETSDPATTKATLSKLAVLIAEQGVIPQEESRAGYEGFSINAGLPQPIYALVKDRLIVTYGENATDDVIDGGDVLSDAPAFSAAQAELGDGYTPNFYVDADAAISLAEFAAAASGSLPEVYTDDVKPWLDPISFVISGAKKDGDRLIQKLIVGIGEGSVS